MSELHVFGLFPAIFGVPGITVSGATPRGIPLAGEVARYGQEGGS